MKGACRLTGRHLFLFLITCNSNFHIFLPGILVQNHETTCLCNEDRDLYCSNFPDNKGVRDFALFSGGEIENTVEKCLFRAHAPQ